MTKVVLRGSAAKPIGAHPTQGCPFAMYQILSVPHLMMHPRYNNDPTKRSDAFLYHCDVGNMLERIVEMESGTVRQACYNILGIFWQYAWLGHFLITTVQVLWDANQCAGLAVGWCRMSCRMALGGEVPAKKLMTCTVSSCWTNHLPKWQRPSSMWI